MGGPCASGFRQRFEQCFILQAKGGELLLITNWHTFTGPLATFWDVFWALKTICNFLILQGPLGTCWEGLLGGKPRSSECLCWESLLSQGEPSLGGAFTGGAEEGDPQAPT